MSSKPAQPSPPSPCPECRGERIWANTDLTEVKGGVGVPRKLALIYLFTPHAFYTGSNRVDVIAAICLQCGYTAFYVLDLEKLRDEYQQHPERLIRYLSR